VIGQFLNYEFELAENGEQALKKIRLNEYDLIIIDAFLPPSTGIETIKAIKKIQPDLPIVIMTDLKNRQIEQDALYSGADKVLSKPFSIKQMIDVTGSYVLV